MKQKINKIEKTLASLVNIKSKGTNELTSFRNEKAKFTTDSIDIKKTIREYYKQYDAYKFLEWNKWPKLTQDKVENTNSPLSI